MKKAILVVVALVLFVGLVSAQDTQPKTKAGNFGWMFTLGGLSNLGAGSYMGGVGAKYYLQDDLALRGGVSFGTTSYPGYEQNPSNYGVNAGIVYNWAQAGAVVGYIGAMGSYGSSKPAVLVGTTDAFTQFGIGGVSGFEWFPYNQLSFSGEYQLMFTSSKQGSGDAVNSFGLGSANSANLTLTVYVK
jgi:hypothetical protein